MRVEGALLGKKVVKVAAGSFHSFALTDEGELYGWGMDEVGQTGEKYRAYVYHGLFRL